MAQERKTRRKIEEMFSVSLDFSPQVKLLVTALGFVLVACIWFLDYVTGPYVSVLIFYLLPVMLIAWYVGEGPERSCQP